jgi:colanic acid/amylovoran biosynthesis glycosyltransferase
MNIALVSTNKQAYSETFIHNHLRLLPATLHFFFHGYLPSHYSTDKGITAHPFLKEQKKAGIRFRTTQQEDSGLHLQRAIEMYVTEQGIDLIFCEYGPSGVAMMEVSKRTGVPLAVHFHGYDAYRLDVLGSYGQHYKALFDHAKAVIGVSQHMSAQLQALGCAPSKLHCLPYGIDTGIFYIKKNIKKQNSFVACGRFVEKKSPATTLRAFASVLKKLPGATLIMIGDGELLPACITLAKELGIGQAVEFTGALDQRQIAEVYSRSLIFVQHSVTTADHDSEGTPLAILESAACGLPAVSTRHAGIPDVVDDGKTGFLVNENDVSAMTEKMLLLAMQPLLAARMGLTAAEKILSGHTLAAYTQQLWQVLLRCV